VLTRRRLRSVLAPPLWSWWPAPCLAVLAALTTVDVVLERPALVGAFALVPLVCALLGRLGDTLLVAAATVVCATVPGITAGLWDSSYYVVALVVVVASSALGAVMAVLRERTAVTVARVHLLGAVGEIATGDQDLDGTVRRLNELLAPAMSDFCGLDAVIDGDQRRIGAYVVGPRGDEIAAVLARRPPTSPDAPAGETRAILSGESHRVDIANALLQKVAHDGEDLAMLRRLGLQSGLFLALRARNRTIGALILLTGPSGRRYSEGDLEFGNVLAGRVALVLDNAGLTRELSVVERQLQSIMGGLASAVTVMDATGRIVYANDAAASLLKARNPEELYLAEPGELMDRFVVETEDGAPVRLDDLPALRALAGDRNAPPMLVRNVVKAIGEERWLHNRITPIADSDGRTVRVVNVIEDVTEVKQAERAGRLLATVGEVLTDPVEPAETLARLADLAVPALGDRCLISHGAALTEQARIVAANGRSDRVLVVPVHAGSDQIGTLTFVIDDEYRRFSDADRLLAAELARRAGAAAFSSELLRERAAIGRILQHGLRPPSLLPVAGWNTATLYRPAGDIAEVGGDFYDIFAIPSGGVMALIGDVAGQGVEAAAMTALARFTLRTAGQITGDPATALSQLNDALFVRDDVALCTAACAHLIQNEAHAEAVISSAGHPLPLLVRDGVVEAVGVAGAIAGAFNGEAYAAETVTLRPDDVLVCYTDGVLDTRGERERFGYERLRATLSGAKPDAQGIVERLAEALDDFDAGTQRDDSAVLALHWHGD
jgi:serine phosphatase RsbU (regulator of sigma subunit)/PAS domain-containing protein